MNRQKEALALFERIIERDPCYIDAYTEAARMRGNDGKLVVALEELDRARAFAGSTEQDAVETDIADLCKALAARPEAPPSWRTICDSKRRRMRSALPFDLGLACAARSEVGHVFPDSLTLPRQVSDAAAPPLPLTH